MRAILAPTLVLSALAVGTLIITVGCDEKMGVEKRAEEIAKSASAQKVSASASASQIDPAELKYKERKAALEKTVKTYRADEARILAGDNTIKPGALRGYYEAGEAHDKIVKELETKLKKDGAEGTRLVKVIEPFEIRLAGSMEDAEVELMEQRAAKNTTGCLLYVEKWKHASDKWVLSELKRVEKADCP
jgi:hypothetical protein